MASSVTRKVASAFLLILVCTPCWAGDRSQNLREAISKIEIGRCDLASPLLAQELARDDADPIANMTLATAYLHTGSLANAKTRYRKALSVRPDDWRIHYALGLISLMESRAADAERSFAVAEKSPEAQEPISILRTYMAYVRGDSLTMALSDQVPLLAQIAAMSALKAGDRDAGETLLLGTLKTPAPPGFAETRSPIPTFKREQPFAVPGGKFTWKPLEQPNVQVVSGSVALKADAARLSEVTFISLYVDGVCTSVKNYPPFEFSWDTTRYSNGVHNVRVEAKASSGVVVSDKSITVRVANKTDAAPTASAVDDELSSRLWNCIQVSASRRVAHYQLGKLYVQKGDRDNAIKHLEYVVAADPRFLDARGLLNGLRGWGNKYAEAWRGKPGGKMIALTFDDGPNERTAEMLEMLAKLKVPATFFVVGFRAETQPDLLRAIHDGGHEIANHSYTHTILTSLDADEVELELSRCAAVIHSVTGEQCRYFRPPGGHANAAVKEAAARQGMTGVFWTVLCSPYEGSRYSSMAEHVINNACDGAVILMHNGEPATTSSLPRIVKALQSKGYRFVTVTELLSRGTAPPVRLQKTAKPK